MLLRRYHNEEKRQSQEGRKERPQTKAEPTEEEEIKDLKYEELKGLAKERKIKGYTKMNKEELIKVLKEGD